ncbi:MAG: AAA family ATPase [Chloroflexota bacterium]
MLTVTIADPGLVLLVGAAGAGKSLIAVRHFTPDEVLSSDALRAAIAGDEADQCASAAAFQILHREVERRLAAGRLTVVDATNVRATHRRPLLARARAAGMAVAAFVLDLPPATVHARNAARDRVVGRAVVERQLGWLRETVDRSVLQAEGIDPVVVLRSQRDIDGLRVVRVRRR